MFNITLDEWARFEYLRQKTFDEIHKCLQDDPHCKSYEGAFTVSYVLPHYFQERCGELHDLPKYRIDVYMYLLNPHGRSENWYGKTFTEALDKAERDLEHWFALAERYRNDDYPDEY
jgi:hypothetical protein